MAAAEAPAPAATTRFGLPPYQYKAAFLNLAPESSITGRRTLTIGGSLGNQLVVEGHGVAPTLHATVEEQGPGRFVLRDAGNGAGTWVNGQKVRAAALPPRPRAASASRAPPPVPSLCSRNAGRRSALETSEGGLRQAWLQGAERGRRMRMGMSARLLAWPLHEAAAGGARARARESAVGSLLTLALLARGLLAQVDKQGTRVLHPGDRLEFGAHPAREMYQLKLQHASYRSDVRGDAFVRVNTGAMSNVA